MKRILVLCTGNSCRSQMAHGYLKKIGGDKVEVKSAGIEAHGLNPKAVEVMREVGIDISGHTSNTIEEYSNETFDYVLTVCDNAKERCPFFPAKSKLVHHNFPDPAAAKGSENEILMAFRSTRDQIEAYCQNFISTTVVA
ncbi:MAG: arsenate reductase ArsC [Cyclobacteriaceae bacterium]